MELSEVYKNMSSHMIRGLMLHDELTKIFDYLNLDGYSALHKHNYEHENDNYRKLNKYYINHHNKLIQEENIDYKSIIPPNWYNYYKQDVDDNTKRNAVKTYMQKWVDWEKYTKQFYEKCFKDLFDEGNVASACFVNCFIQDVDDELKKAERYVITCEMLNYDLPWIISEQERIKKKYEHKRD